MAGDKKWVPEKASRGDAPGKVAPLKGRLRLHEMFDCAEMAKTDALAVELAKVNEIAALLWLSAGLSEETGDARIVKVVDQFNAIKPTDATESMLAAPMIGTNAAALECLRRAMLREQSFEGRNMALKHA